MNLLLLSAWVCLAAVLLDLLLGEPRRWHPLVGFGRAVTGMERWLNTRPERPGRSLIAGGLGLLLLTLPLVGIALFLDVAVPGWAGWLLDVFVLYLALSLRGLAEHGRPVASALRSGDLQGARSKVGRIVSRRAEALDEPGVAAAATESMLENGADAVFASLFWYVIAGLPGVLLHRLVNTLDAMWGYRNERYLYFGRCAARLDDVMNWLPARLTALTYALLGKTSLALRCWRRQGPQWDSPNAGPVMAAGAGALGVTLGGPAPYASGWQQRPFLGDGPPPDATSIEAAIRLVTQGVWLWLAVLFMAGGLWAFGGFWGW
jgi:adenosylcobinamide-phosphate synthase